ncbi:MAG: hypothetical protein ACR2N5_08540, partial [Solirubrobacterales bacterium]
AAYVASQLEIGAIAPWRVLLLITSGQLGFGILALVAVILGVLVGSIAVARSAPRTPAEEEADPTVREPRSYAGTGSLTDAGPIAPTH